MKHRRPSQPILFACVLMGSVVLVIFGWNGAKNTPRDGWSWVKASIGAAPVPGSGDRAYFVAGYGGSFARLEQSDLIPAQDWVMVLVRRDRSGLFLPWLETYDLRMVSGTGKKRPWQTGTDDPRWHETLRAARVWYVDQDTDWHRTVVAGIDTELAGGYPDRRIRPGFLMLELLVLLAHGVLIATVLYGVHRALKAHFDPAHQTRLRSAPISGGFESV